MNLKRKIRLGKVVSDKMDKTAVVKIERIVAEKILQKRIKKINKVKADDRKNICKTGDKVKIIETRPLSKEKRWKVLEIIK